MADLDRKAVAYDFAQVVNMSASELERWLTTDDSRSVGWTRDGEHEAIGHQEGRRIVEMLHRRVAEWTDDDYQHMRKVVSYVHRHLAEGGPAKDAEHSRWRYSLMNWGHDPLK